MERWEDRTASRYISPRKDSTRDRALWHWDQNQIRNHSREVEEFGGGRRAGDCGCVSVSSVRLSQRLFQWQIQMWWLEDINQYAWRPKANVEFFSNFYENDFHYNIEIGSLLFFLVLSSDHVSQQLFLCNFSVYFKLQIASLFFWSTFPHKSILGCIHWNQP